MADAGQGSACVAGAGAVPIVCRSMHGSGDSTPRKIHTEDSTTAIARGSTPAASSSSSPDSTHSIPCRFVSYKAFPWPFHDILLV
eukprot:1371517-Prymnesium_polylepis.2